MYPIIIDTPFFRVYSYGLMISLAILLNTILAMKRGSKEKLSPDYILEAVVVMGVSGIIGARIFYIILNWSHYAQDLSKIFQISAGGLSSFGALIMGGIALSVWGKYREIKIPGLLDFFSPYIFLGYSLARIGCFLNGCCYGKMTDVPWALPAGADNLLRHPVQLYASLGAFLLFFLAMFLQRYHEYYGNNILLLLFFYPLLRFMTEFFRDDASEIVFMGLTSAQLFSVPPGLMAGAVIVYNINRKLVRKV